MARYEADIPPLEAKWIARNPAYREPPRVWQLCADYDREAIMREITMVGPKRGPRKRRRARPSTSFCGIGSLPVLVRHLMIDGYDRPLRRWALERCRRGMNAIYFSGGLFSACVLACLAARCTDDGLAAGAFSAAATLDAVASIFVLVYGLSRIAPILAAAAYARIWLQHMPRAKAAPRYWGMYGG
jgi:hypothetical protein